MRRTQEPEPQQQRAEEVPRPGQTEKRGDQRDGTSAAQYSATWRPVASPSGSTTVSIGNPPRR